MLSNNASVFHNRSNPSTSASTSRLTVLPVPGPSKRKTTAEQSREKANVPQSNVKSRQANLLRLNKGNRNIFAFTGGVERVIQRNKIKSPSDFFYVDLMASVIGFTKSQTPGQNILLLRDRNGGPIMQVIIYNTDRVAIEDFHIGQMLRCFGYMTGPNMFRAFKIRNANEKELSNLPRYTFISDRAVAERVAKHI